MLRCEHEHHHKAETSKLNNTLCLLGLTSISCITILITVTTTGLKCLYDIFCLLNIFNT